MIAQITLKRYLFSLLLLLIVVWGVFDNTLLNGFVWDDLIYTVNNPVYTRFDVYRIFTTLGNGIEYLPVRDLSYALDYLLWGSSPAGFHAINILIYWLTVMAVFSLALSIAALTGVSAEENRESRALLTGLVTALLFCVHPIHSEVVSFITCRNALLSTLFFLLSASLYLRFLAAAAPRGGRLYFYAGALVCYFCSIFSKATGIILPLILVICVLLCKKRNRIKSLLPTVPFFLLSIAVFFLLTAIASEANIIREGFDDWSVNGWITKIVKAVQITIFYLWKLIAPYGYSAEYDVTFAWSPATLPFLLCAAVLAALAVLAFCTRKTRPYIIFGLGWYLVTLIPVLNFFTTRPIVADRYAFLPSFGFFFIVASAGVELSARINRKLLLAMLIALISVWGGVTIGRNTVWFSEQTLWQDTIRVSPRSAKAYTNLGRIYFSKGDYDRAFSLFASAMEVDGADPSYYYFMGFRAYTRQDLPRAIDFLKKSLGRKIDFIEALFLLGQIYAETGEKESAAEYFRAVVRSRDPDPGGFRQKAIAHLNALGTDSPGGQLSTD